MRFQLPVNADEVVGERNKSEDEDSDDESSSSDGEDDSNGSEGDSSTIDNYDPQTVTVPITLCLAIMVG